MTILPTVFLLLAAGLILLWLVLAVRGPRAIDVPNVVATLRYGAALRTAALILALAPPTMMAFVFWFFAWRNDVTMAIAGGSFFGASLAAGLLFLETRLAQVVLTEDGITRSSPWTGRATLPWSAVERVRYSPLNRWFVLSGAGRTIRVSRHLVGVSIFVDTVRRKVPAERSASAAAVFAELEPSRAS